MRLASFPFFMVIAGAGGAASACGNSPSSSGATCGSGTTVQNGVCVIADSGAIDGAVSSSGSSSGGLDSGPPHDASGDVASDAAGDVGSDGAGTCPPGQVLCSGSCTQTCLQTIASGLSTPAAIAVDSKNVYWTDLHSHDADGGISSQGAIMSSPLDGGGTTTLASASFAYGIVVDDTSVYWVEYGGGMMKVPLGGGAAVSLAPTASSHGMAKYGNTLYWTDGANGLVLSVGINGGTVTTLATGQVSPYAVTADATDVYWTDFYGGVMKAPLAGGTPVSVGPNGGAADLAVDSTSVYWAMRNATILKSPIAGGVVTTLAVGGTNGSVGGGASDGLVTDGASVYWADNGAGVIMRVPVNGGMPVTLAASQNGPTGIAVDSTSVYWTNAAGGSVMRLTPK